MAAARRRQAVVDLGPAPAGSVDHEARISELDNKVTVLEYRVAALESDEASVSTEEDLYATARTKFCPFLVHNRGVTSYLDGFKIKLAIGNMTNATFHGGKLKVSWGSPFDKTHPGK